MPASFSFTVEVKGVGDVQLPVTFLGPTPVLVEGIQSVDLPFEIANPLPRGLTIPSSQVTVGGPDADKVSASLLDDVLSLPANGTIQTTLQIQTSEPLTEAGIATVTVQGTEG